MTDRDFWTNAPTGTNGSSTAGPITLESLLATKRMLDKIVAEDVPHAFDPSRVRVSVYACTPKKFLRWKKSHRRSRINKKWHKRYGAEYEVCRGVAFQIAGHSLRMDRWFPVLECSFEMVLKTPGTLVVCPCMWAKLKPLLHIDRHPLVADGMR